MSAIPDEPILAHHLYLRDHNGRVYAIVRGAAGVAARSAWASKHHEQWSGEATQVRHRKTGEVGTVQSVETATNMLRLVDDEENSRSRWFSVDDFEVTGANAMPLTSEQRKQKLEQTRAQLKELEAAEKAEKAPAKAP